MFHRGRGNRGGAFPYRGRGAKSASSASSESNVRVQVNVEITEAIEAFEVHHSNSNTNRGMGSRRRPNYRPRGGFQSHAGTTRGQSRASSRGNFQKPKPSVPRNCGDSGMVPYAERQISHSTQNKPSRGPTYIDSGKKFEKGKGGTSQSQASPVDQASGKTAASFRGRSRGGKGNPTHGGCKDMDHSAKYGGSRSQQSSNRKKMDNMKKSVSCGICLEVWTRPKTLPCDHVFCEKCLEKIVIRNRQVLTCPECRQEHTLPPQGLRNSWFTQRYLESLADDLKDLKT